jgi:tripartite-type tricarboxylate transporter receptor subunit TctC
MKQSRRQLIHTAAITAAAMLMPRLADADTFPTRPLRLVVGFPPGGPNDTLARLIAGWLASRLGQPVAVENQPGNAGNIATAAVVRAAPDGHTLLLTGPANAISGSTPAKLDFVFLRDIAPVGGITREPLVLLVHPAVTATTAAELIAYAKANPGKMRLAATGTWSSPHVTAELFRMLTGISVELVQYGGGGPALKALAAGDAQMMFEPMSAAIGLVRTGKLRALAVTTTMRSPALPEVPTLADTVAGFEASAVTGIGVPHGTPNEIVARLNHEINAAFTDQAMRAKLLDTGGMMLPGTPVEFAKLLAEETEKWGKVVRFASGQAR